MSFHFGNLTRLVCLSDIIALVVRIRVEMERKENARYDNVRKVNTNSSRAWSGVVVVIFRDVFVTFAMIPQ